MNSLDICSLLREKNGSPSMPMFTFMSAGFRVGSTVHQLVYTAFVFLTSACQQVSAREHVYLFPAFM